MWVRCCNSGISRTKHQPKHFHIGWVVWGHWNQSRPVHVNTTHCPRSSGSSTRPQSAIRWGTSWWNKIQRGVSVQPSHVSLSADLDNSSVRHSPVLPDQYTTSLQLSWVTPSQIPYYFSPRLCYITKNLILLSHQHPLCVCVSTKQVFFFITGPSGRKYPPCLAQESSYETVYFVVLFGRRVESPSLFLTIFVFLSDHLSPSVLGRNWTEKKTPWMTVWNL